MGIIPAFFILKEQDMDNKKKEVKDEHELIRLNKFLSDAGVLIQEEKGTDLLKQVK